MGDEALKARWRRFTINTRKDEQVAEQTSLQLLFSSTLQNTLSAFADRQQRSVISKSTIKRVLKCRQLLKNLISVISFPHIVPAHLEDPPNLSEIEDWHGIVKWPQSRTSTSKSALCGYHPNGFHLIMTMLSVPKNYIQHINAGIKIIFLIYMKAVGSKQFKRI